MITEKEIQDRIQQERNELDELLRKSMDEEDQYKKDSYLGIRSKVYERVIALEWVLGIRKSIDD